MSLPGNWSADALAEAAEKCLARIDDADLSASLAQRIDAMSGADRGALASAVMDAFRERGEASEDVAEELGADAALIASGDAQTVRALLTYAQTSAGLLKEAVALFVERAPNAVVHLPQALVDSMSQRLAETAAR